MNTARHCAGPCSVSAITPMPTPDIAPQPAPRAIRAVLKVPEVTAYFWIITLLSTAMGESTSDYLVFQISPYIAVVLGCLGLVVALLLQLWVRRYVAWIYWLAVVMVAVFGTMAADVTHVVMGIPYLVSTVFFAAALAIIFATWYASEKTLSIHSVYAGRREMFYWSTVWRFSSVAFNRSRSSIKSCSATGSSTTLPSSSDRWTEVFSSNPAAPASVFGIRMARLFPRRCTRVRISTSSAMCLQRRYTRALPTTVPR